MVWKSCRAKQLNLTPGSHTAGHNGRDTRGVAPPQPGLLLQGPHQLVLWMRLKAVPPVRSAGAGWLKVACDGVGGCLCGNRGLAPEKTGRSRPILLPSFLICVRL